MDSPTPPADRSRNETRAHTVPRETVFVWISLLVLGVGFGVLVPSLGLPWWMAPLISGMVLAGSAEFVLVGLIVAGATLPAIAMTTFVINARHAFYPLAFPLDRVTGRLRRAYSVFALTDEAFALLSGKQAEQPGQGRILRTQIGLHASWVLGSLCGAIAGASLLKGLVGFEFVLLALFVVLAIDAFAENPSRYVLFLAVLTAGGGWVIDADSMLLTAMFGFAVLIALGAVRARTEGRNA